MRIYIIILLIGISMAGKAQHTWNKVALADEMSYDEFAHYIPNVKRCKTVRAMALSCFKNDEYRKAVLAYERIIFKFRRQMKRNDIANYYKSLLKLGMGSEIPNPSLSEYDKYFPDLIRQANIQQDIYEDDEGNLQYINNNRNQGNLVFGYSLQDSTNFTVYNQKEDKLLNYTLNDSLFEFKGRDNPGFKSRFKPLTVVEPMEGTKIYTVYDEVLGLYRIKIRGDSLPAFKHNSRKASCAMPWFDKRTKCLFYSVIDRRGYGGWDIAFTKLKGKRWSKPQILDERINTQLDEVFPSVDGDILLYSSDGHKGKGKLDNYAFDMMNKINYNLIDCNSPEDDYCIRLVNNDVDFYVCRSTGILKGSYEDFWDRAVVEEEMEYILAGIDSLEQSQDQQIINILKNQSNSLIAINTNRFNDNINTNTNTFSNTNSNTNTVPVHNSVRTTKKNKVRIFPKENVFNIGEPVYFSLGKETIKKISYSKLNHSLYEIEKIKKGQTVVVFGATDASGSENFNYFLSLNRARRIISYLKRRTLNKVDFVTIASGEQLTGTKYYSQQKKYREGYCKISNLKLPYELMIAVPLKKYNSVSEIAEYFNNPLNEIEKLKELLEPSQQNKICLAGIQTIHRVYFKETLYGLATRYGCSVKDLMRVNGKSRAFLKPGELLIIPLED